MSSQHGEMSETAVNSPEVPAERPTKRRSTFRSIIITVTCTGALVSQNLGATAVTISLPTIGAELGIEENQLQWLTSAFALSSGCLLLFFGRIADLYGRKRVFLAGMLCALVFTIGCSFGKDAITLDVLRAFQGVGLAAGIPSGIGILAHSFEEGTKARSIAFATFSSGAPIGAVLGGVVGGALIKTPTTWRSPFYFYAAVLFVVFVLGLLSFDDDTPESLDAADRRVDWIGATFVTSGLVLIIFVLGQGELAPRQWKTPYIIGLLITGVILIVLFLFWQRHLENEYNMYQQRLQEASSAEEQNDEKKKIDNSAMTKPIRKPPPPIMKLSLFSRGNNRYAIMMLIAFLQYTNFLSWYFWMQLFYQNYLHLTPLASAVRLLTMPISGVLCNVFVALVIGRLPVVFLLVSGTTMSTLACLLFAIMDPSRIFWVYQFPALIISVFGADFIYAAGTLYVARCSRPEEQSVTGAIFQTMTQVGVAFGVTITTVVFNRVNTRDNGSSSQGVNNGSLRSYRAAWWTCVGFGAVAIILSAVFFRDVGIVGDNKKNRQAKGELSGADEKQGRGGRIDENSDLSSSH